ncbi:MAG: hypothetical protein F6K22_25960, partial [Okeania sp. SIO2F4]|uniref:hypothetical protein n=1 Tax=Okeania sp. SIO2F4 TaxID=2607790 RepID=UPI00142CB886
MSSRKPTREYSEKSYLQQKKSDCRDLRIYQLSFRATLRNIAVPPRSNSRSGLASNSNSRSLLRSLKL